MHGVRVQDGRAGVWLTLDDLTNRAQVIYGKLEPEATAGGVRTSTSWADDINSQRIYGVKESQYEMNLSTAAQAAAFRDQNLAKYKRVSPRPVVGLGAGASQITIDLVGYWSTLDWRFYSNSIGLIENVNRLPQLLVNLCTGAGERFAQSITVSDGNWRVESIWFCVRRCNAGSTITVSLCANSAGSPGSVLASTTMNGATLSKSARWTRFLLSSPVVVAAGTYWIVFQDNTLNNYKILVDYNNSYGGGVVKIYASGAWGGAVGAYDLQFRVAGTMETTEQIKLMAAPGAGGQFLAGARVDQASGIYNNPKRDGDTTALDEITNHLAAVPAAGGGLQAAVTVERMLIVGARPDPSTAGLLVRSDGIIRLPGGQIAQPGPGVAGSWAVIDSKWAGNSANWLSSPGRLFIERAEWSEGVCRAVSG